MENLNLFKQTVRAQERYNAALWKNWYLNPILSLICKRMERRLGELMEKIERKNAWSDYEIYAASGILA